MFGFQENDAYDDVTHAKVVRSGSATETIFVNPSEEPSMMVAELKSKEPIGESEAQAFSKKYEHLGFEFYDGHEDDGILIWIRENVGTQDELFEVISQITLYKP